jgi:hypothetical protein
MNFTSLELKIIGAIAYTVFLFGGGYFEGWKSNHDEIVALTATAKAQTSAAKQKDAENEQQTYALQKSYHDTSIRLNDALDRLHNSGSSGLSKAANSAKVPDGYTAVEGGTCQSAFYDKALKAELMVEAWQEWAIRQRIPVAE